MYCHFPFILLKERRCLSGPQTTDGFLGVMVLSFWVNLLVLSRQHVPEGHHVCCKVGGRLQIQPQPQCAIKPPVAKAASTESLFLFTSPMLRNLTVSGGVPSGLYLSR